MKKIILITSLFFSFFGFSESNIEKGNKSFENKQYEDAIQYYLKDVSNEKKSSELFYNLGNSYFKINEIGEAIWAYQQALKIDPTNEDINFNFRFANNLTLDKTSSNSRGIGNWLSKNIFQFSPNFWYYVSLFCASMCAIFLYLFFRYKKNSSINNFSLVLTGLFGIILIISTVFSVLHKSRIINDTKAVVINSSCKVLTQPVSDAPISFELHEGTLIKIKSIQKEWCEVNLNNNTGWVEKNEIWLY